MKWVLRATGTQFFVTRDGQLTARVEEAYDVPSINAATELCSKANLLGMELVLRVNSTFEASIPMGEEC